jgi:uncharacterized surface protein with fasciclin (FAS1) repeats
MIRTTIAGLTAAAAIAGSLALAVPAQAAPADELGNPYDFNIVNAAIEATEIELPATFTAFFPNDRAFEVLANNLGLLGSNYRYGATVDEGKILDALVKSDGEVSGLTLGEIEAVLAYHVVPDAALTGADVVAGKRIKSLTMANGDTLKAYVVSKSAPFIVLGDQDGRFFNDYVVNSKIDYVKTDNVVIHGISDVLLP